MTTSRNSELRWLLVVVWLVGAGCSSNDAAGSDAADRTAIADAPAGDGSSGDTGAGGAPSDDGGAGTSSDTPEAEEPIELSPIEEFLGMSPYFNDDLSSIEEENHRITEEAIAACMREQGFDYVPEPPREPIAIPWGGNPVGDLQPDDPEYLSTYGFGLTTQWYPQQMLDDGLVGYDGHDVASRYASGTDGQSPNDEILDAMTPEERTAYDRAISGNQEEPTGEGLNDQLPGGCRAEGRAAREATDNVESFYRDYQPELADITARVDADPRVVAMNQEIEECVEERGIDFRDSSDLRQERAFPPEDWPADPSPLLQLTLDEIDQLSAAEIEELARQPLDPLPDEFATQLAELQRDEIDLAVATDACGGGWWNKREREAEVRADYEQELLDSLGPDLDAYRPG